MVKGPPLPIINGDPMVILDNKATSNCCSGSLVGNDQRSILFDFALMVSPFVRAEAQHEERPAGSIWQQAEWSTGFYHLLPC